MMCFKDRGFCGSDCINTQCERHFGDKEKREAGIWWGSEDAPVDFSDFKTGCDFYKAPPEAA